MSITSPSPMRPVVVRSHGVRRKKALLHRFGSAKGVSRATVADLQTVEGVNEALARRIYDFFHGG